MKEKWLSVNGFEGIYEVSNYGNVASLNYNRTGKRKNLTPKTNNKGYLWVELRNNGKKSCILIHRLVAEHFIDNPNNYEIVNHKDENPRNNMYNNLEWCNASYNTDYSKKLHLDKTISNGNKWDFKESEKYHKHNQLLIKKDFNGNIIEVCGKLSDYVKTHNLNAWSIIQVCNGKRKSAYGYYWEFKSL